MRECLGSAPRRSGTNARGARNFAQRALPRGGLSLSPTLEQHQSQRRLAARQGGYHFDQVSRVSGLGNMLLKPCG